MVVSALLLCAMRLSMSSAGDEAFGESALREALGVLQVAGVDLRRDAVDLDLQPGRGWTLILHTDTGQVRALTGIELPRDPAQARMRLVAGLRRLLGPFQFEPAEGDALSRSESESESGSRGRRVAIAAPPPSAGPDGIGGRLAAEIGSGLLGAVVGMAGGALIQLGLSSAADCSTSFSDRLRFCDFETVGIAGAVGSVFGIAGGVALGGQWSGGRGHFGWSLLGALTGAGLAAPFLGMAVDEDLRQGGAGPQIAGVSVLMGVLSIGGSVAFYELFADGGSPPEASVSSKMENGSLEWMPSFSAGVGGASIGIAGRF
ncbi:MAG TPA: hypothetical protein RMG48_13800 [Myxococcales bacterium LLY-WYZ-16_1]|nr:hypothetical protein [Myxococcales bacterium LLY-WYZ-16_1]